MSPTARTESGSDLLNIKEAAAFLKVSEASLRRWTNSGALNCMRLGARRERRFRIDDLNAFMSSKSAHPVAKSHSSAPPSRSEVLLEGVSIAYGTHICTLYESDLGRIKWSVPFLLDGLVANEGCFLVATPATQVLILGQIRKSWKHVDQAIEDGQFIVTEGIANGEEMCRFVERSIILATQKGRRTFRLLGDMSWCRALGMAENELIAYEHQFNREIGHSFPLVSICQYDTRDFSGPAILNALKCHEDTFNYPLARFFAS